MPTTSWSWPSARCRGCCRSRASSEHAVGFKSLADAIWLRNHVDRNASSSPTPPTTPRCARSCSRFLFVGGGYAGLEALAELQDFAAEAMKFYPRARLHGMRWVLRRRPAACCPRSTPSWPSYAMRELRGRGIDIRLGTTLEEVTADGRGISTGETIPTRTVVWTAGVVPHPSSKNSRSAAGRARAGSSWTSTCGCRARQRLGARRCRRRARPGAPGQACPPTSQHAIRQGKTVGRNVAAALGVGTPKPFSYRSRGSS